MNKVGMVVLTAVVAALVSFGTFKVMEHRFYNGGGMEPGTPVRFTANRETSNSSAGLPDLILAANAATQSVVHLKVLIAGSRSSGNTLEDFFGMPQSSAPARASGSGVIISNDGYIVTNNHVVEGATRIQVVLPNKRTFQAKLIGRDPNTDLALVKISSTGLVPVKIGNSDNVQIGEWVLAVGYPFSLNTTVTAGIVSAKERSIGILDRPTQEGGRRGAMNTAVEAFIQTDAAINPGNSGGALVNAAGELIGINAAIASQTGSYEGYGFAIPVNLVRKIAEDLRMYGVVKRGFLGVNFPSPASEDQFLQQQGITPGSIKGVYITGVQNGSAAAAAGLKNGDIIQRIGEATVNSSVEFSERIARQRPGDKVMISYLRGSRKLTTQVTLQGHAPEALANNTNNTSGAEIAGRLGAQFAPVNNAIKQRYRVSSGLLVTNVADGGFFSIIGIPRGSIITSVNGKQVNTTNDLYEAIGTAANGTIRIDSVNPNGSRVVFNLALGA